MGLLSNFRKQSANVEADPAEVTPALDFEFGDEPAQEDDQWLQAVDRRKSAQSAQDADPFLSGIESEVPAAATTPVGDHSVAGDPIADASIAADALADDSVADDSATGYTIINHAPPATLMSTAQSEPMPMEGQPDFPAEDPPAVLGDQPPLHTAPAFESYDLLDSEDPPVAFAYDEEPPSEIIEVQQSAEESHESQASALKGSEPEPLPNLGMVFAGLSDRGIMPEAPLIPPMSPPAPPQVAPIDLAFGPLGPQALPHLHAMGLTVGVSWPQVTQARRSLMEQNPADGTAEQQYRRVEINHASASLRLLRVGPLVTA